MENSEKLFDYLKRATAELKQTRERLRELEAGEREPVAIVGMGCRYPGGVQGPEDLWELVRSGVDAVSGVPVDRGWVGAGIDAAGGFVADAAGFDAGFFGISPREAMAMDPQQRVLLEVCWEALERAGIGPGGLRGSRTGVFAGTSSPDYPSLLAGAAGGAEGFAVTGNTPSVVSGRVSYVLGLEGPAVSVDTACSSSLVALHLACAALRAGECDLALAGGVMVMSTAVGFAGFGVQGVLAGDGRCKAFGAGADGMGLAEGAGMVLVERLSDARRNGHPVLAVVAGSAVNQDGASNGLTAPSGPSQQRVIRAALAAAGLSPGQVDVVEAHGTGTVLGDPIEAQALIATYGQGRDPGQPLWLGSVKSNIGHTQAAAGVAGVIKMVMALRHRVLPPTLHADQPSAHIDWSAGTVRLLTGEQDWPAADRPRRAAVSSFGISGTNAHVILESPPEEGPGGHGGAGSPSISRGGLGGIAPPGAVLPWVISARGAAGLRAQAERLRQWVKGRPELDPVDVGWSLAAGRSVLEDRAVVLAADAAGFAAGLEAVAAGEPADGVVQGRVPDGGAGKTVFVFPGQGGQWAGMTAGLADTCPAFAARLDECAAALQPHVDWPVAETLRSADPAAMERVDVVQPVLWAVMVALAAAWESIGVVPDAVAGHSQGEIAAAAVAGILALEDAARMVAVRSKALADLPEGGGMAAVAWPAEVAGEMAAGCGGRVWVAAVNSPGSVVLAGDRDALAGVLAVAEGEGIRTRWLPVSYASHGPAVDQVAGELARAFADITPVVGRIPFWSAVTGEQAGGAGLDGGYWVRNLREQVRFEQVTLGLAGSGHAIFIEVSPHPVLVTAMEQTLGPAGCVVAGTLRRDDGGRRRLLAAAAEVFTFGADVDWASVFAGSGARQADLPTYAFQRRRYWPAPSGAPGDGAEAGFWAAVDRQDLAGVAGTVGVRGDEPLSMVLPALAAWRRRRLRESAVDRWRYQVTWQPVPGVQDTGLSGRWLLVIPDRSSAGDLAGDCAEMLAGGRAQVVTMTVDPAGLGRAGLAGELAAVASGDGFAGVVSLLALDGVAGTLVLLQALGDAGIGARLWVITCGAVAADRADRAGRVDARQAMTWGLGRVAALEHPARWGGLVDMSGTMTRHMAGWLRGVLSGQSEEDQVAVTATGVVARRLVRAPAPNPAPGRWRPSGPVLVTGATGALGPVIGRWLARAGAQRVVMVSRQGMQAPGMAAVAARVAGTGAAVTVAACDVSKRADLAGLLGRLAAAGAAIRDVFHAAAVIRLGMLDQLDAAGLAEVCEAKVAGAANLDELLGASADTFVLFSSIAGTWGSGNHGAYAAANAYLDALAQDRRARGLAAISVPWGVWRAGRERAAAAGIELGHVVRQGLSFQSAQTALAGLRQVLDGDEVCTVIAEVDWARFVPVFTSVRPSPLLAGIPEARLIIEVDAAPATTVPGRGVLAGRLAGLGAGEQDRLVLDIVREQAAAVLGYDSAEAVRPGIAFRDLGFDSLTAVELRDKLNVATALRLPATLVFDYPTPRVLARWLRAQITGVPASAEPPAPVAAPAAGGEQMAVVGIGCRFPGGVASAEDLWQLVRSGTDAICGFPPDRGWEAAPRPHTRPGGFLQDAALFDAAFFGISPREALAMDPQQRLLLEVCWEALERAGISPHSLQGSRTGVFAGVNGQDYAGLLAASGEETAGHALTGTAASVVSGRVAYVLGLEGPAVSVDTACSSSLVALHLACQALRGGECDLALAGGVTIMATQGEFAGFGAQGGLAADGRCKAFGAGADGMSLAEGAAILVVERLADARRHGHPVLAVVAGSAVNQDGASNGLTAPNGPSQQRVIRAALASAGLEAGQIDAVEAHGTGTVLGDPIEAQALIAVYGQDRPEDKPLWLGSIKSNLGHTQAAAGAAGIIKMIMALRARILPPTLHAADPSPHIDWSGGPLRLLTQEVRWPRTARPRRAAVSSFGISGTNVHTILSDPPAEDRTPVSRRAPRSGGERGTRSPIPWVVSGRGEAGLRGQAARLAGFARAGCGGAGVADVGWSLAAGRSVFAERAVVLAADTAGFAAGLGAVAAGEPAAGVVSGRVPDGGAGKVVFVFAGQGSQRAGMGRVLAGLFPVFAQAVEEVCGLLDPLLGRSVRDVVFAAPGTCAAGVVDQTVFTQAGLFAVEVALARLLESWGITPDVVTGHSIGEIAAAHVAGMFSLADACALVAARGQLMQALGGGGAMAAIAASEADIQAWLDQAAISEAVVAAVNGPRSVVVSGAAGSVAAAGRYWRGQGVRVRRLRTSHAFHSPLVEPMLAELAEVASGLSYRPPAIPVVCSVTGQPDAELMGTGAYWVRQAREAVQFAGCARWLSQAGATVFAELGADGTLSSLAASGGGDDDGEGWVPVLRAGRPEPATALTAAAEMFTRGVPVDWAVILGEGNRVDLPTYAFQRQRYWPRRRAVRAGSAAGGDRAGHPLLGTGVELAAGGGVVFTSLLSVGAVPWLADHAVSGMVLVPGTGLVEMAVAAGRAAGCGRVVELTLEVPLVLPGDDGVRVQVTVADADGEGQRAVEVHSRPDDGGPDNGGPGDGSRAWTRHASGVLGKAADDPADRLAGEFAVWPPAGASPVDIGGLYDGLAAVGCAYGPAFRGLTAAWRHGDDVLAEVVLPGDAGADAGAFGLHPALLDAGLHALAVAEGAGRPGAGPVRPLLPFSWSGVSVYTSGARELRVRLRPAADSSLSLAAADSAGVPVVAVDRLVLRPLTEEALQAAGTGPAYRDALWIPEWVPVTGVAAGGGRWAVVGGDAAAVAGLAAAGVAVSEHADLAALSLAVAGGEPVPQVVAAWLEGLTPALTGTGPDRTGAVRGQTAAALGLVQEWLAADAFAGSLLVVVTAGAVATGPRERATLGGAGVWGLIRSAQAENPGQLLLADVDGSQASWQALAGALGWGEPELAVRQGRVLGRRLARAVPPGQAVTGAWRLEAAGDGMLGGLVPVPAPEAQAPLLPGQVRVAVRAAGLNFRDALITLGLYPGAAVVGSEGAGVVTETGPGTGAVRAGDRVLGLWANGLGPVAVADERMIAKIPAGWSFTQAASVPIVFATAYYALVDLAGLRPGETVLIHAAAGGVGMAAVQLARYLGAQVYATASPAKQAVVAGLGVDPERIASSRTAQFAERFRTGTGGRGVDVVLDSLAGELVDASLGLVAPGGRFVEMGKADVRDQGEVAARWPGVSYQAFDLVQAGPARVGQILSAVLGLFARGILTELPVRAWELDQAGEALRFMGQGQHTGKNVVRIPVSLDGSGTVLVTGASGVLAGLTARHLAGTGRAGRLLLVSRRGPAAPGAARMAADLAGAGAQVQVAVCDTADRAALAGLIGQVPAACPLAGVIHTAGVLDDGVVSALTPDRVGRVLAPKADAALWLDELTASAELSAFVLFSSASATFGSAGQGNYAAANAVLDALAADRRARGLPGVSIAWGMWDQATGMTEHLGEERRSQVRGGVLPLSTGLGLELLDQAMRVDGPVAVAVRADVAGLRAMAGAGMLLPLWRGLIRVTAPAAPAPAAGGWRQRLDGLSEADQDRLVLDLVREQAAEVLGHASAEAVRPGAAFRDLGFDSLTAVDLRNRLAAVAGMRLPATLVFDHPAPEILARWLRAQLTQTQAAGPVPAAPVPAPVTGDPVAIVGMACRFPGGVRDPEGLWDLVAAGTDAISGFPEDRGWDLAALLGSSAEGGGTSTSRAGGFVYDAAEFDAGFFGISPREALAMDPQQRLLLEVCWEALERAGIVPGSVRGSRTGVFVGAATSGYGSGVPADAGSAEYVVTGNATSVLSGRVAYALGLEGPAVSVDTACSSSLVALHLAAQALRAGECDLALAGGVSIMVTPGAFVGFSRMRGLSADGRCRSFAASADGSGWGEGAGMLLVERLSDARRRGHPVLAVVAGSAVNQDGASNGLTAPNGPSQQRVIRAALAAAQVSPDQVDAVEAHGSATVLGDPIEAQAVIATYGQDRPAGRPLWLGSVKSNIGHTQATAGAAGLIKMVMAFQHGTLPRTLHADEPTPQVDWTAGDVRLLTEPVPWPGGQDRARHAGVSAFAISGTNAHIVLAEPSAGDDDEQVVELAPAERTSPLAGSGIMAWPLSGRSAEGLAGQAGRLAGWVRARPDLRPADVGWSLATTRSMFEHRAVVIGADRDEMIAGLTALTTGEPAVNVVPGVASMTGRVVLVFPGQGSQWAGMGRELAQCCPVFATRLAECGQALAPHVSWDLLEVLAGAEGAPALDAAQVVQPVLWAVMVSLASVWEAAGVVADAVVGHSQGEIAAATVAGMLSLEDAAKVVAARSHALSGLGTGGGMVSVVMRAAGVEELIGPWGDRLAIAAVNGPVSTVVSGDSQALAEFQADLAARHVLRWPIPATDFVAHSERVADLEPALASDLAGISPRAGKVRLFSTVRCEWIRGPELDAGYWFANLRQRVRFDETVRVLAAQGYRAFIEVSPHAVLTGAMTETLEETGGPVPVISGTLDREDAGGRRLMSVLAGVYARGVGVDWAAVLGAGNRVELPTYAFQRRRYWLGAGPQAAGAVAVPVAGSDGAEAGFWAAVEREDLAGLAGTVGMRGDERLSEVLPVLAAWRRQRRARAAADRWRYQVTWQPVPGVQDAVLGGRWLLVAPPGPAAAGLADACAKVLADGGAQQLTLVADAARLGREVLAGVLRAAARDEEFAGTVSLLALDESGRAQCPAGLAGTLALVQALGDAGIAAPLWVLTSGAVAASQEGSARAAQAMTWGLGRVAAMEYPARWGGLIDLPPWSAQDNAAQFNTAQFNTALSARMAGWLRGVLSGQAGEDQVAIREAGVLSRRVVPGSAASGAGRWRPSGTVLVTGGTGAAGGQVARWLAGRDAPGLVLASRRGIATRGGAGLAARVAGAGTPVTVSACDVADRADLAALWRRQATAGTPVRAVVHAAGVLDDGVIDALTPARLAGVAAVKVAAARWLDELAGDQVDAFVLFSSMACAIGTAGQGNYAAANAALDAIAEDRRARGLAGTSVAWGVWGGGSGLVTGQVAARAARGGVTAMPPRAAAAALGRVLDLGGAAGAAVMVADVNWARYAPAITGSRPSPLLSGIPEARQAMEAVAAAAVQSAAPAQGKLADRLAGLPVAEREQLVLDVVCGLAAMVLGHDTAQAVPGDAVLQDLGFDSLTAVEFRNRLETVTGLTLSTTLVFDFVTPAALARHVQSELAAAGQPDPDAGGDREEFEIPESAVSGKAPAVGGLCDLYYQAFRGGQADDFIRLMKGVAGFRDSFDESHVADLVHPTLLARGATQPSVICFPAYVGRSNAYQYARLAAGFRKVRDVAVLANPGFAEGEPLPANVEALVRAHASAVERCAAGSPFVLLGHSSGGYIAHTVAAHLETIGISPAAVVLIDTFSPADTQAFLDVKPVMEQTMLDREDDIIRDSSRGDAWVTAMARYFDLDWWDLRDISAPILHVRAAEALDNAAEGDEWNVSWRYARTVTTADVPGNHFSLIKEHADMTAQVVNGWLTAMFQV